MKHLIPNVSYMKGRQVPFTSFFDSCRKNIVTALVALVLIFGTSALSAQSQDLDTPASCETGLVAFPDLSTTAGAVNQGQGDDALFTVTLPFTYSFAGGAESTTAVISTNGHVGSSGNPSDFSNSCPAPDVSFTDGRLGLYHDDLDMELGSASFVWTMSWAAGDAGHPGHPTEGTSLAAYMVHWDDAQDWPGFVAPAASDVFDFAVLLYEDGSAAMLYGPNMVNADQAGASVYADGPAGTQNMFSCNTAAQVNCDVLFVAKSTECDITLFNCPLTTALNVDLDCSDNLIADYTGAVQLDNPCGRVLTFTQSPAAATTIDAHPDAPFADGDVMTVTVTVTDEDLNTYDCLVDVTLNDSEFTPIQCLDSQVQEIAADCGNAVVPDFRLMAGVNNGCNSIADYTQTPAPGTLLSTIAGLTPADGESYMVDITVTGNPLPCDPFAVTLDVTQPFTLTGCPTDIAATTDGGDCTATVTWTAPMATPACGHDPDTWSGDCIRSTSDSLPRNAWGLTLHRFSSAC